MRGHPEYEGLGILYLYIVSVFSRQIAIGNGGPASGLESCEQNHLFAAIIFILVKCTNGKREKDLS